VLGAPHVLTSLAVIGNHRSIASRYFRVYD